MTDDDLHFHSNFRLNGQYEFGDWELSPRATIRYKDADFNSQYYAFKDVTSESIGAGIDVNLGIDIRYHVISNLYLLGSTSVTRFDDNAFNSSIVEDRYQGEFYLGFGLF